MFILDPERCKAFAAIAVWVCSGANALDSAGTKFLDCSSLQRLNCDPTPEGVHRRSDGIPRAILLLEDLDMGHISSFFRQFSRAFDHLLAAFERRSGRLLSGRRFARRIDSTGVYLKKRLPQWHSKLRSLVSKVGAKTSTSSR